MNIPLQNGTRFCNQVSLAKLKGRYAFYGCQSKSKRRWPQLADYRRLIFDFTYAFPSSSLEMRAAKPLLREYRKLVLPRQVLNLKAGNQRLTGVYD
jgi:hypothetical protein